MLLSHVLKETGICIRMLSVHMAYWVFGSSFIILINNSLSIEFSRYRTKDTIYRSRSALTTAMMAATK